MRISFVLTFILLTLSIGVAGQTKNQAVNYLHPILQILKEEKTPKGLLYRLDTLKAVFIPSRSDMNSIFDRVVGFGFRHQRIGLRLNWVQYNINLLTKADSIVLYIVTSPNYKLDERYHDQVLIGEFIRRWNNFYRARKTQKDLFADLSRDEVYAFYCGDGSPKTSEGIEIERIVAEENIVALSEMLTSFNCERQSYAVAGVDMLVRNEAFITPSLQFFSEHVKKRNSELVTCSGCIIGIIEKIYSK